MRKIVLSGVAALGFLAIGMAAMPHGSPIRQAQADGIGADVRITRHSALAMIDTNGSRRPMLVATNMVVPQTDTVAG
jgi:hypothetical protein